MRRYPGLSPFSVEQKDLFFGREDDIKELSKLIFIERKVLLYSKSGFGKTSLLNAGVIPELKKKQGYEFIKIRFREYNKENPPPEPAKNFLQEIKTHKDLSLSISSNTIIDKYAKNYINEYWSIFKKNQLLGNSKKTYVLIFDQFEELFGYPNEQINRFKKGFSEIIHTNKLPAFFEKFEEELFKNKGEIKQSETEILYDSINIKAVFSIRSDRMSELNYLANEIYDIQKVFYELKPLSNDQAKRAIKKPAEQKGNFKTKPFIYEGAAIGKIINLLTNNGKQILESTQLQIVCQQIEENEIAKGETAKNFISTNDISDFHDIFRNFYTEAIAKIESDPLNNIRTLIEDHLIIDRRRISLDEYLCKPHVNDKTLNSLIEKRILRAEKNSLGGTSYEISHDTLIEPIEEEAKSRRIREKEIERRRRFKMIGLVLFAVITFLSIIAFWLYSMYLNAEEEKQRAQLLTIALQAKEYLVKNPTYSVRLAEKTWEYPLNRDDTLRVFQTLSDAYFNWVSNGKAYYKMDFNRHSGNVSKAIFSPYGKKVLSASWDRTAMIWDSSTGEIYTVLKGHKGYITDATFLPDGKTIVTTSFNKSLKIWDVNTGNLLYELFRDEDLLEKIIISSEGGLAATISSDSKVKLWDLYTGQYISNIFNNDHITNVFFSSTGNKLAGICQDKKIKVLDIESDSLISELIYSKTNIKDLDFSPNEKMLVLAFDDNTAEIHQLSKDTMPLILRGHTEVINKVCFSLDGQFVVTASYDKTVKIWNPLTGRPLHDLRGHKDLICDLSFSPYGKMVATSSWDHTVKVWSLITGKQLAELIGHNGVVNNSIFSKLGREIITASVDKTVKIWKLDFSEYSTNFKGHEKKVTCVDYHPSGERVISVSDDKTAKIWDTKTGKLLRTLKGHKDAINFVKYSSNGKLIVTASSDKTAIIWNAENFEPIKALEGHMDVLRSSYFSKDASKVITSGDERMIIWDTKTGNKINSYKSRKWVVSFASFSPNAKKAIVVGSIPKIINSETNDLIMNLRGSSGQVSYAIFSPDGKRVLTISSNDMVSIWDSNLGNLLLDFDFESQPKCVNFSSDGRLIVGSFEDGTIKVIDLNTEKTIMDFKAANCAVNFAVFSPDNEMILTGSDNGKINLWPMPGKINNWLKIVPIYRLTNDNLRGLSLDFVIKKNKKK